MIHGGAWIALTNGRRNIKNIGRMDHRHKTIMNLKPLNNRILVKELPSRAINSPIVLPQTVREEFGPKVYEVCAVGPKVKDVFLGQRVLAYSQTDGPLDLDNDNRKLITEDQVLAIV